MLVWPVTVCYLFPLEEVYGLYFMFLSLMVLFLPPKMRHLDKFVLSYIMFL